jgi:hypothetical protein
VRGFILEESLQEIQRENNVYVYNKKQKTVCLENDNICYTFSSVSEVLKFFNITKGTLNYKRKSSKFHGGLP